MSSSSSASLSGPAAPVRGLRKGALTALESLAQSIANIAPTLTPAINISVVAGLAGAGSWLAYLVSTVAMIFVAANINALARRHALSGSFFIYIGRTLGPFAGAMAGWSMIAAYLLTAVAVILSMAIFVGSLAAQVGLEARVPPTWLLVTLFTGLVAAAAYRDIKFSSRIGLLLEGLSIGVIVLLIVLVTLRRGTVIDPTQSLAHISPGGVMAALTFGVFSFVGFESSATLAKETADPARNVPRAIMISAVAVGLFFTVVAYFMVMGVDGDAALIGRSASPFAEVTAHAGMPWGATIVYCGAVISAYACALASVNAAARLIFSMGRFRLFAAAVGAVHDRHETPHRAVIVAAVVTLLITVLLLPVDLVAAFGYAGTVATFGFIVVYLLVCIVAPLDRLRHGDYKPVHGVIGVVGVLLMLFCLWGSVYPVPDFPSNLLPYIFLAYLGLGAAFFLYLKFRAPETLLGIEHDLEG